MFVSVPNYRLINWLGVICITTYIRIYEDDDKLGLVMLSPGTWNISNCIPLFGGGEAICCFLSFSHQMPPRGFVFYSLVDFGNI